MAKRTRRQRKRKQRKTRKTVHHRGGDYRQFTSKMFRGSAVTDGAAITTPTAVMTLEEFREREASL